MNRDKHEFKHEFPPTQDACCIHCHVPAHMFLRYNIKCSGPQSTDKEIVTQGMTKNDKMASQLAMSLEKIKELDERDYTETTE